MKCIYFLFGLLLSSLIQAQTLADFQTRFEIKMDSIFLSQWELKKTDTSRLEFEQGKYRIHIHGEAKSGKYFYPNIQSSIFVNNLMRNQDGGTSVFSVPEETCQQYGADWCVEYFTQPKKEIAEYEHCKILVYYSEPKEKMVYCIIFFNNPDDEQLDLEPQILTFRID